MINSDIIRITNISLISFLVSVRPWSSREEALKLDQKFVEPPPLDLEAIYDPRQIPAPFVNKNRDGPGWFAIALPTLRKNYFLGGVLHSKGFFIWLYIMTFYLTYILTFYLAFCLTFYLTFYLVCMLAFFLACVRVHACPAASGARDRAPVHHACPDSAGIPDELLALDTS